VGVYGFDQGGLIIDAGKNSAAGIGDLACRADVPDEWQCLLITPPFAEGASGAAEQSAFERLPPMPPAVTDRLCAIALRELLPAVHVADFAAFSAAVFDFGCTVGQYFEPVQGGVFADQQMARLVDWLRESRVAGVGQTSWGPTLFAFCPGDALARQIQAVLERESEWRGCAICRAAPLNQGAVVRASEGVAESALRSIVPPA
jgi:predicted sugar kinase